MALWKIFTNFINTIDENIEKNTLYDISFIKLFLCDLKLINLSKNHELFFMQNYFILCIIIPFIRRLAIDRITNNWYFQRLLYFESFKIQLEVRYAESCQWRLMFVQRTNIRRHHVNLWEERSPVFACHIVKSVIRTCTSPLRNPLGDTVH